MDDRKGTITIWRQIGDEMTYTQFLGRLAIHPDDFRFVKYSWGRFAIRTADGGQCPILHLATVSGLRFQNHEYVEAGHALGLDHDTICMIVAGADIPDQRLHPARARADLLAVVGLTERTENMRRCPQVGEHVIHY